VRSRSVGLSPRTTPILSTRSSTRSTSTGS
jgi:hypothetical protein